MNPLFCTLITATLFLSGCAMSMKTQRITVPKTNGNGAGEYDVLDRPNRQGVFYALPRTVIVARTPVIRFTWSPGRYSDMLPYFFPCFGAGGGVSPLSVPSCGAGSGEDYTKPVSRLSLGDPRLESRAEPDPAQLFLVDIKGHYFEDKKMDFKFSEDGVPDKVDAEADNKTVEIIAQGLKSAAAVFAKVHLGGLADTGTTPSSPPPQQTKPDAKDDKQKDCANVPVADKEFASQLDQDDRKFFCELPSYARAEYKEMSPLLRSSMREYNPIEPWRLSRFLAAWASFKKLAAAQDRKTTMLQGGSDAAIFSLQLKLVEAGIADALAEFFGTISKRTLWDGVFEARIVGNETGELFRIATKTNKICKPATPAAWLRRTSADPEWADCTEEDKPVAVTFSAQSDRKTPDLVERSLNARTLTEAGFFYRVPGEAIVTLQDGERTALHQRMMVAQLGAVIAIPKSTNGRKSSFTAELYGSTGALKNFKVGSTALFNKDLLTDGQTAATSVIDAKVQREKDLNPSTLSLLEKRRKELEEAVKIRNLEQQLANGQPANGGQQ